jgi:hypothetical protein
MLKAEMGRIKTIKNKESQGDLEKVAENLEVNLQNTKLKL